MKNTEQNHDDKVVDISLTMSEVGAVIKSLSIGCDQLVKKLNRLESPRQSAMIAELHKEYTLLLDARQEIETVYAMAIVGDR